MLFELSPTCNTQKDSKKIEALYVVVSRKSSLVVITFEKMKYQMNTVGHDVLRIASQSHPCQMLG